VNKEKNILSSEVIIETRKQLVNINSNELVKELDRIITNNKVGKPDLHNNPTNQKTDYYKIDLQTDQIEIIVMMFGNLEVYNLGHNYESTELAIKFANLLDKWNELHCYR